MIADTVLAMRILPAQKRFQLPSGFQLLMGDVSAGSSTVSMVRQVLNWQKSKPEEASRVISFLHAHNAEVEDALMKLDKLFSTSDSVKLEKLHAVRKQLASSKSEQVRGSATPHSIVGLGFSCWTIAMDYQWQQVDAELGVILKNAREAFLSVRRYLRCVLHIFQRCALSIQKRVLPPDV